MSSWLAMLQDAAEMFVFLAVELSLLFIVISAGVSLIRQKVPDHKIQQMMGARKGKGYLLAAYSALFDHGLASKSDQRFASIRST
ncbi:hypothetical protein O5817_00005, partial [Escherichia coli]|nr:hypothetical protein [Escherichia coli]